MALGGLAFALAALGIFGVLACVVEQRTREIGIRMALGATRRGVIRSVVLEGVKLVTAGLLVGFVVAGLPSRLPIGLLFEVEPTDPVTLLLVAAVAVATGVGAAYLPGGRRGCSPWWRCGKSESGLDQAFLALPRRRVLRCGATLRLSLPESASP